MSYRSEQEDWNNKKQPKRIAYLLFWGITGILLGLLIIRLRGRVEDVQPPADAGAEESGITMDGAFMDIPSTENTSMEEFSVEQLLAESIHRGRYCYELLSDAEKCWYAEMYVILDGMQEEGELSLLPELAVEEAQLDKVFQCLMNDHPELFFVRGYSYTCYTYTGVIARLGFTGLYTMDTAEREERQQQIEAQAEQYLQGISSQASDYEKVKYVYETIVLETEYKRDAEDSQNIYSVFVNHESVCQGYAKAAQYLLERLGVKATLVKGSIYGGESHAWNLVWIDGVSYYMDATWGDAYYQMAEEEEEDELPRPAINYDYLCVTTEQLEKTHLIENVVPVPACISTDANYYVMEGAYFTDYDETAVADFFAKGYEEKKTDVTLKCADEEIYALFYRHLIEEYEIFNYLDAEGGSVAYAEDLEQYSMTFWLVDE
ncbi:MAG: hypothetical protein J1E65_02540 [Lachnospiraceae bacterium]|nr:hypothetical protein [Lachnospiraceae bacterium]